jgi:hypothetical protein
MRIPLLAQAECGPDQRLLIRIVAAVQQKKLAAIILPFRKNHFPTEYQMG